MALEIERRFLVADEGWRKRASKGSRIRQGYIAIGEVASVRVRIRGKSKATLTIKSRTSERRRLEFEYEISSKDAVALLALTMTAKVDVVLRTASNLAPGSVIVVRYENTFHEPPLPEVNNQP